jgi:hypothetical protein
MSTTELDKLTYEHAKLDSAIEKMSNDKQSNENKLSVMKRHKLWLKDKIQNLESKEEQQT